MTSTTTVDAYRAAVPQHLDSWDLADPARLLHDLAAATPLRIGSTLLCQVARPATDQLLVAHTRAWPDGRPADEQQAQDQIEVQLASAMRARAADRSLTEFVTYDSTLHRAAAAENFRVTSLG